MIRLKANHKKTHCIKNVIWYVFGIFGSTTNMPMERFDEKYDIKIKSVKQNMCRKILQLNFVWIIFLYKKLSRF